MYSYYCYFIRIQQNSMTLCVSLYMLRLYLLFHWVTHWLRLGGLCRLCMKLVNKIISRDNSYRNVFVTAILGSIRPGELTILE